MAPKKTETPEAIAKKKFIDRLVKMAMEPAKDYALPSESLQVRPPRIVGTVGRKENCSKARC
jgi:hypothetical protein